MFGDMETPLMTMCILTVVGVLSYYFYSRFVYVEKKIGFLQNVIMEMKMAAASSGGHGGHGSPGTVVFQAPQPVNNEEVEPLPDETYYETIVSDEVASAPADAEVPSAGDLEDVVKAIEEPPLPNYEAMSKNELQALVKQRSLKVSKTAKVPELISVLKKSDAAGAAGVVAALGTGSAEPAPAPAMGDSMLDLSESLEVNI
jgi:hypothetical protein